MPFQTMIFRKKLAKYTKPNKAADTKYQQKKPPLRTMSLS